MSAGHEFFSRTDQLGLALPDTGAGTVESPSPSPSPSPSSPPIAAAAMGLLLDEAAQSGTAASSSRAPFPYYGGKQYLVPHLLPLLPPHRVYVEVFGGAASLLFSKAPAPLEVYNDADGALVNLFRVMRDPEQGPQLDRALLLTPYSRAEWRYATMEVDQTDTAASVSAVERARAYFVMLHQSFSGHIGHKRTGWRYARGTDARARPGALATSSTLHNPGESFYNAVLTLASFRERLRGVEIECADFAQILDRYDSDSTLFYVDPPYVHHTRTAHDVGYQMEMSDGRHADLLAQLMALRGAVVLSGYRSTLYDEALLSPAAARIGWRLEERPMPLWSSKHGREVRREAIYLKPAARGHSSTRQVSLWSVPAPASSPIPEEAPSDVDRSDSDSETAPAATVQSKPKPKRTRKPKQPKQPAATDTALADDQGRLDHAAVGKPRRPRRKETGDTQLADHLPGLRGDPRIEPLPA